MCNNCEDLKKEMEEIKKAIGEIGGIAMMNKQALTFLFQDYDKRHNENKGGIVRL